MLQLLRNRRVDLSRVTKSILTVVRHASKRFILGKIDSLLHCGGIRVALVDHISFLRVNVAWNSLFLLVVKDGLALVHLATFKLRGVDRTIDSCRA